MGIINDRIKAVLYGRYKIKLLKIRLQTREKKI